MSELGWDPASWRPSDVFTCFLARASTSGRGTMEKMTTNLRAFLRFLAVAGRCPAGLDNAVPAYAHWQLAYMPRYLSAEQVSRLIAACDGDTNARRRDRAIVLLLARLGLRAGDVAQLRLADIEWQTGSLRVCGKSRTEARLPLPQERRGCNRRLSRMPAARSQRGCVPAHDRSVSTIFARRRHLVGSERAMKRAGIVSPFKGAHVCHRLYCSANNNYACGLAENGGAPATARLAPHQWASARSGYPVPGTTRLAELANDGD